uniref:Uncharacterized 7.9 kDa protein in fixW 5'region n=1 Tax=Rhizobium leguminosarum TaxID=384 RepID=YFX1_RHILE|nr:RecName: Full=Uncharacterized 7.9 kDa protein in fixW 5'region [Rhizobium leguminosarum]CAA34525.1 unnamed protein product [Rhizobium leguminosarum]
MHIVVCIKQFPGFGRLVSSSSGRRQLTATQPRSDPESQRGRTSSNRLTWRGALEWPRAASALDLGIFPSRR